MTIYLNNDVEITSEPADEYELKININGQTLILISREEEYEFKKELAQLLDKYRI